MSQAVVPWTATCGQRGRIIVEVTGEKVSLGLPAVWGFSQEKHLVDLRLEEEGDRGVDPKEVEYALQAVLNLYGSLPVAVNKLLNGVRGDEVLRRAVSDRLAAGVCVAVRYVCELFGRVGQEDLFPVLDACDVGEARFCGGGRCGCGHMFMFVERIGGALGASMWSRHCESAEGLAAPYAGALNTREYGAR